MAMGSIVVDSNRNHLLSVLVPVLVAGQGMPVHAQVAVHVGIAGQGLAVALEDQTGDAGVGPEMRAGPGVDVRVGGGPAGDLVGDAVDQDPGEKEVGDDDDAGGAEETTPLQGGGNPGL